MTDPITAALLMLGGITGVLLLFAGLVALAENVERHLHAASNARSAFMHDHIRRMK